MQEQNTQDKALRFTTVDELTLEIRQNPNDEPVVVTFEDASMLKRFVEAYENYETIEDIFGEFSKVD